MAKITESDVKAKATEYELTLTDEQIKAHVLLQTLPSKPSSSGGDKDDDNIDEDDDKSLGAKAQKRIRDLIAKRKEDKKAFDDLNAKLTALETDANKKKEGDMSAKGEYEKLKKEYEDKKKAVEAKEIVAKNAIADNAISIVVSTSLLKLGLIEDYLDQALKLFDFDKVEFEWTNEDTLEYDIDSEHIETLCKEFKEATPVFFEEVEPGEEGGSSDRTARKPGSHKIIKKGEEKEADLQRKFPALRNMIPRS